MDDQRKKAIETAKDMLEVIRQGKDHSKIKDYNTLFFDAESIVGAMAWLVGPMLEAEQDYRKLVIAYMESGDKHNAAETKAKVSDVYKDYKKIESAYKLADEQIKLLKKFASLLQDEYRRTQ